MIASKFWGGPFLLTVRPRQWSPLDQSDMRISTSHQPNDHNEHGGHSVAAARSRPHNERSHRHCPPPASLQQHVRRSLQRCHGNREEWLAASRKSHKALQSNCNRLLERERLLVTKHGRHNTASTDTTTVIGGTPHAVFVFKTSHFQLDFSYNDLQNLMTTGFITPTVQRRKQSTTMHTAKTMHTFMLRPCKQYSLRTSQSVRSAKLS